MCVCVCGNIGHRKKYFKRNFICDDEQGVYTLQLEKIFKEIEKKWHTSQQNTLKMELKHAI